MFRKIKVEEAITTHYGFTVKTLSVHEVLLASGSKTVWTEGHFTPATNAIEVA